MAVSDYISREVAIKACAKWLADVFGMHDEFKHTVLHKALTNIPAADVVEVVRCKNCKHYGNDRLKRDCTEDKRYKPRVCFHGAYAKYRDPDWFCADGERRDGDAT